MRKNKFMNPDATYSKKFLRARGGNKKKINRSRGGNVLMFLFLFLFPHCFILVFFTKGVKRKWH